MPRRRPPTRPRRDWTPPHADVQERRGGADWYVRRLTGASAKTYTCPGCLQPVRPGTAHLLVWPVVKPLLADEAIDERRHWHTACWQRAQHL